jgi:hypothetical protein
VNGEITPRECVAKVRPTYNAEHAEHAEPSGPGAMAKGCQNNFHAHAAGEIYSAKDSSTASPFVPCTSAAVGQREGVAQCGGGIEKGSEPVRTDSAATSSRCESPGPFLRFHQDSTSRDSGRILRLVLPERVRWCSVSDRVTAM